jgi:hypothetical protein
VIRSKPMRRAALGRAAAPRRCGKKFPTREAALNSPVGKAGGYVPEERCGCGSFHARVRPYFEFPVIGKLTVKTVPPPRPRKPRVGAATGLPKPPAGFSREVRLMIRARAGDGDPEEAVCEACGRWLGLNGGQVQHIIARKMGGCDDPVINSAANGALLHGTAQSGCHGLAEARDKGMGEAGFWLEAGTDPRAAPMWLYARRGTGVRKVWRSADGRYLTTDPRLGAVA